MKQQLVFSILAYFRFFAKLQLLKNRPTIIGVTGSAGKTSTRDAIYAAIKNDKRVKVSYKANSESGIPLNILGLSPAKFTLLEWLKLMLLCPVKLLTNWEKYSIYLVEMGIDGPNSPKNMEYLLTIIQPDIGIILNAAPMHSQQFDYLVKAKDSAQRAQEIITLIAKEKGKIVTSLNETQTAVINIDQQELVNLQPLVRAKILTFGKSNLSDIQILDYNIKDTHTIFSYKIGSKTQTLTFKNQLLPQHFAYTFAASIAVGRTLHISLSRIISNLEQDFKLPEGRSSFITGINGSKIIDSSYNSSTKPALDMLDLLTVVPGKRKFAVLGDIRELGAVSQLEHEAVAQKASEVCDAVLLIGPQMKQFALPVVQKIKTQAHWFKTAYQAADFLQTQLKTDDIILVKGSQNTLLLEIVVEQLMAQPENAQKLLARRGAFWDKKRAELKDIS